MTVKICQICGNPLTGRQLKFCCPDCVAEGAKMVRIDGKKYKTDTWYAFKNGKVVEVADGK